MNIEVGGTAAVWSSIFANFRLHYADVRLRFII